MGKLYSFLLGVVIGFGLYHAAINYHFLYAADGLHMVHKTPPRFEEIYIDVREFTPQDWVAHPELAAAVEKAGKQEVITNAVGNAVKEAVEQALPQPDGS